MAILGEFPFHLPDLDAIPQGHERYITNYHRAFNLPSLERPVGSRKLQNSDGAAAVLTRTTTTSITRVAAGRQYRGVQGNTQEMLALPPRGLLPYASSREFSEMYLRIVHNL